MERFSTYYDIQLQNMEKLHHHFPLITNSTAIFHLLRY